MNEPKRGPLTVKRTPQVSTPQTPAPEPLPMAEVQAADVEKAEQAIADYKAAQVPKSHPCILHRFNGGAILEGGVVVSDAELRQ